jgi:hypothetical protein
MAGGRCLQRAAALVFAVAFSMGIGSATARAQSSDDLDALNQQVQQLYRAGKYPEAANFAVVAHVQQNSGIFIMYFRGE